MKVVVGNNTQNISKEEFAKMSYEFNRKVLDIGTGDGRFIYDNALANANTLFIGIDPVESQLKIYSKKAVRKKLNNVLFAVGSIERFPPEITTPFDEVYIILPWGSLLKSVVTQDIHFDTLKRLVKSAGTLELILGYHFETEPSETKRLKLPKLDENTIMQMVENYNKVGLRLIEKSILDSKTLKDQQTSWSKKLSFGKNRPIYRFKFICD